MKAIAILRERWCQAHLHVRIDTVKVSPAFLLLMDDRIRGKVAPRSTPPPALLGDTFAAPPCETAVRAARQRRLLPRRRGHHAIVDCAVESVSPRRRKEEDEEYNAYQACCAHQ